MRLDDIVKYANELCSDDLEDIFLWAVDSDFSPFALRLDFNSDDFIIYLRPLSYRAVVRYQMSSLLYQRNSKFLQKFNIYVTWRNIYIQLISDGIQSVEHNGKPIVDITSFLYAASRDFLNYLSKIILIINGLDDIVRPKVEEQLKKLEEISFAFFANILKGQNIPSWAAPLVLSYQIFRERGTWSKPNPVDESYILWQAWLAIARGENRYYDSKNKELSLSRSYEEVITLPSASGASYPSTSQSIPPQVISSLRNAIDIDGLLDYLRSTQP